MNKLLSIEFLKISNYRIARFFILLYFVLLGVAAFGLSQNISFFGLKLNLGDLSAFDFPNVWHFVTYFAAIAKLFLAIIIITTVTNEFSYGTLKQNLIDGLTKKEFIFSKTLTAVILSFVSTLVVFLIALILGLNFTEGEYSIFEEFKYVPAYFLKLITFFSFCIFLSVLVRKSAFAFALFFIWWIMEAIFSGIETLIRFQMMDQNVINVADFKLTNYLPLSSMAHLIPLPFKRFAELDKVTQGQMESIDIDMTYVLICVWYFIMFTYASYWLVKKRDL